MSEHDIIVRVMAEVQGAVRDGRGAEVLDPLLSVLARYTAEHFATEERVLRRYGYGHADAQAAFHARLLESIPDLRERMRRGGGEERQEVSGFLRHLSEHLGYRPDCQERSAA